jgi:hypothetical protein
VFEALAARALEGARPAVAIHYSKGNFSGGEKDQRRDNGRD